jgi:hypothetical protein
MFDNRLDGAILAGGVATFDDDKDALAAINHAALQLDESQSAAGSAARDTHGDSNVVEAVAGSSWFIPSWSPQRSKVDATFTQLQPSDQRSRQTCRIVS